jgi:hypothetical protein
LDKPQACSEKQDHFKESLNLPFTAPTIKGGFGPSPPPQQIESVMQSQTDK